MLDRLIDFLLQFIGLFKFWVVVDVYQRAVVLRLGRHSRTLAPGFHWVIPLGVERVIEDNVIPRTIQIQPQSLTTKDGETIVISAVVTAYIEDIEKALLGVEGVDHALTDSCFGALGEAVAHSTWEEVSGEAFSNEVTKACRRQAKRWGMCIERVQLGDRAKCVAFRHHQSHGGS